MEIEKIFGEEKLRELLGGRKKVEQTQKFFRKCYKLPEVRRNLRQLKRYYFSGLTSPDKKFKYFEENVRRIIELLEYNPWAG